MTQLDVAGVVIDVVLKDIKNIHLGVHPPTGRVRISAPRRTSIDSIRAFAVSQLAWIRSHQRTLLAQDRESPREYIDLESHHVWGRRYLLRVVEGSSRPHVELTPRRLLLHVRPSTAAAARSRVLYEWYRAQLKAAVPSLLARWEPVLGASVERYFVQRMKTKWGSCNHRAGTIRLNTELAKKPPELLEYVLVHELVHLLEPTHNRRFVAIMDWAVPGWRQYRRALNSLPLAHDEWPD